MNLYRAVTVDAQVFQHPCKGVTVFKGRQRSAVLLLRIQTQRSHALIRPHSQPCDHCATLSWLSTSPPFTQGPVGLWLVPGTTTASSNTRSAPPKCQGQELAALGRTASLPPGEPVP